MPLRPAFCFNAVTATLVLAAGLAATPARAQDGTVRAALEEAAAVHAIATAARLCNLISEVDLARASNRMDRVHTQQLAGEARETYRIVRGSDGFRNSVFASALRRARGDCTGEVAATWNDVNASLVQADIAATPRFAAAGDAPSAE